MKKTQNPNPKITKARGEGPCRRRESRDAKEEEHNRMLCAIRNLESGKPSFATLVAAKDLEPKPRMAMGMREPWVGPSWG